MTGNDRVLRAMTDDGAFRVMTLRSTDTVAAVVDAQNVRGAAAGLLGEVVTGAVLVRETMAPWNRVQVLLRDKVGNQIVGDAYPEGRTRGLARVRDTSLGVRLENGGLLQVVRRIRGRSHEGIVEAGAEEGIAEVLVRYFLQSEQVHSMVGVACVLEDEEVRAAGGYVVQLLPEVTEPPLARMRERLQGLGNLAPRIAASDSDPERLLGDLMADTPHSRLAESGVSFACPCDDDRVVGAVSALGTDEIRELLERGETLSVTCDYCQTAYEIGPKQLRTLLEGPEGAGHS